MVIVTQADILMGRGVELDEGMDHEEDTESYADQRRSWA